MEIVTGIVERSKRSPNKHLHFQVRFFLYFFKPFKLKQLPETYSLSRILWYKIVQISRVELEEAFEVNGAPKFSFLDSIARLQLLKRFTWLLCYNVE